MNEKTEKNLAAHSAEIHCADLGRDNTVLYRISLCIYGAWLSGFRW